MEIINTPRAPGAVGPYSQAIKAGGLIFCSGQIAKKVDGTMVENEIKKQTAQVLDNLKAVLAAAGSSLDQVVKTTVYLTDLGLFSEMNEAYEAVFGGHKPARATVEVSGLPKGALIEIECVALAGQN